MSRIVVALGGNALLRRGEPAEAERQKQNMLAAAPALAALAAGNELVITHGNGPQVGLLALEAEAYGEVAPYPLDVLGAESQGMIGYVVAQALEAHLDRSVATVLTRVEVDPEDPAFETPTKPIGPMYTRHESLLRNARHPGWTIAPDGDGYRRVVPSPAPVAILELRAVESLLDAGHVVVCAGGGGIPVRRRGTGYAGVEAVVDKDRTAALLAHELAAAELLILTDVPAVFRDWGTPAEAPIGETTPDELRGLDLAAGSMGPKVEAACRFVEWTGRRAAIGSLEDLEAVAAGRSGTHIVARRTPALALVS